jgi:hypothetical protein
VFLNTNESSSSSDIQSLLSAPHPKKSTSNPCLVSTFMSDGDGNKQQLYLFVLAIRLLRKHPAYNQGQYCTQGALPAAKPARQTLNTSQNTRHPILDTNTKKSCLANSSSLSMLEPVHQGAVSPDRALCLPTFSHFLIANKTSLSLSLCLSPLERKYFRPMVQGTSCLPPPATNQ